MTTKDSLATVYFMKGQNNFEDARKALYKLGIKTSYDSNRVIFNTMHSYKNNLNNIYAQECNGLILERDTWKPLCVPTRTLRYNINDSVSNSFLHQGLYNIFKVQDGTCFNLYYYQPTVEEVEEVEEVEQLTKSIDKLSMVDKTSVNQPMPNALLPLTESMPDLTARWVISTASGYEMNNVRWENKTYLELISECLSQINLSWDAFTSALDKTNCYSFGFKHPEFHHFNEGRNFPLYKLWFIQSVDLNTEGKTYLWANDNSPIESIPNQAIYEQPVGNLGELYILVSKSINDFKQAERKKQEDFHSEMELLELYDKDHPEELQKEFTQYKDELQIRADEITAAREHAKLNGKETPYVFDLITNTGWSDFLTVREVERRKKIAMNYQYYEPCYGFILRSVNFELTGYNSDLFIESVIMRNIRKHWYENNMMELCTANNWQSHKETVVCLNAYLDMKSYQDFQMLFPQYQEYFYDYNTIISKVVTIMLKHKGMNQNQTNQPNQHNYPNQPNHPTIINFPTAPDDLYQRVANTILKSFTTTTRTNTDRYTHEQKRRMYFEYIIDPCMLVYLMPLLIHH